MRRVYKYLTAFAFAKTPVVVSFRGHLKCLPQLIRLAEVQLMMIELN